MHCVMFISISDLDVLDTGIKALPTTENASTNFQLSPGGGGARFLLLLVPADNYCLPVNQYFDGTGKKDLSQNQKKYSNVLFFLQAQNYYSPVRMFPFMS